MSAAIPISVRTAFACFVLLLAPLSVSACSGEPQGPETAASEPGATAAGDPPQAAPEEPGASAAADEPLPPPAYETVLPEGLRAHLHETFKGDLDEMVKRRLVRVGVTYSRTHYFIENGVQRGGAYEYGKFMEEELNKRRKTGNLKVNFVFVPLPRHQLLPALLDGKIDVVLAKLTMTPEREKLVDFSNPYRTGVDQIVVTGPGAPAIASVEDLAGQQVFVRKSTAYYESLLALNERLKAAGKPPVEIQEAPELLEDDDLLEMVNAGLIKITIADNYLADFWKQVFTDLNVHHTLAVSTGGKLAPAFRKNSPQLAAGLNRVIAEAGRRTAFGNIIEKRYLKSTKYVKDTTSEAERKKFREVVELFRKYGDQYELDYLLMAAQGYQESGLDHSVKSRVGAVGVMQVMPATGKELNVGDVTQLEPNIHAGVKYIRFLIDEYFKDEPMTSLNKGLFAFASYNAGPGRIRQLRREAAKRGLDPNEWFGNVEQIASERIGRETVTYVSNIYKYWVAYRLGQEREERIAAEKETIKSTGGKQAR